MTRSLFTGNSLQLHALSFLLGIILIQFLADLFSFSAFFLLLLTWSLLRRDVFLPYFFTVLLGYGWVFLDNRIQQSHQLQNDLIGKNIVLQGLISSLPVSQGRVQRFKFKVEQVTGSHGGQFPRYIRLSWYQQQQIVNAGERWQFTVRLKPPHGFMNPGGFDYERWLYHNRIDATGYVRKSSNNKRLEPASVWNLDRLRQQISQQIQQATEDYSGLISALAVGDKRRIEDDQWQLLTTTGTSHLMAISGLHIGLVAGFVFWFVRRFSPYPLAASIGRDRLAALISIAAAFVYALLAGFAIPTQRALIMLLVVLGSVISGRHLRPGNALALALVVVLLVDPRSVLAAGFWFSFMAVAVISYSFSGRLSRPSWLQQWGRLQWVIALALFPVTLFLFQQASIIAPLVNLILVPWVSFLVVPLVLLGVLLAALVADTGHLFFQLAESLLMLIWPFVQYLGNLPFSSWQQAAPGMITTALAVLGCGLLLAPRGLPMRQLGLVFCLPALMIRPITPDSGDFQMHLLDVGQGLAVLIQTRNHNLLFDSGAKFSESFDAGDRVVVPLMKNLGLNRLDKLVISHGDNDHKGGVWSLIKQLQVLEVQGQDIDDVNHHRLTSCRQGQHWQWDGVQFEFLHPDRDYTDRNNRACVLKISHSGASLLIASDIEHPVEQRLVEDYGDGLGSSVLIVPHHGSKTSSSSAFIHHVGPQYALVSAGYRNRFGHPRKEIIERYQELGVQVMNTAESGAIFIDFDVESGISVPKSYRNQHYKYWNHRL